jgi:hypothetical protein
LDTNPVENVDDSFQPDILYYIFNFIVLICYTSRPTLEFRTGPQSLLGRPCSTAQATQIRHVRPSLFRAALSFPPQARPLPSPAVTIARRVPRQGALSNRRGSRATGSARCWRPPPCAHQFLLSRSLKKAFCSRFTILGLRTGRSTGTCGIVVWRTGGICSVLLLAGVHKIIECTKVSHHGSLKFSTANRIWRHSAVFGV